MFRILAITATLLGLTAVAHADVWRWTDPQGHVQYSDRWVPGSVLIKIDGAHQGILADDSDGSQRLSSSLASSNAAIAEQQQKARAEQTVKNDLAKSNEELCKKYTAEYQKAIESRRLYKEDKDGKRVYSTDAEADAYRLQLLESRKAYCGK
jgi:Domain of unknown function (DUF4124)